MEKYPLIDPPFQSITLADGRCLEWQEFGAPNGKPVLYFHGGGSSSFEAGIFHREAVQNGVRLISTNRPGAGGSTICPGRVVAAYADDLTELLDRLGIDKFACFGESNGGLVTLAVAGTMTTRVLGAVPINPTVPWFDPVARSVTPGGAAIAYRLMKYVPWLLVIAAAKATASIGRRRSKPVERKAGFDPADLIGPPPGTEEDVADVHWRTMDRADKQALRADIGWSTRDWGFDHYTIPVPLDFFCGVHDAQAPFALVLADRNPDARFHYFSFGHHGFSHPDARRRILDKIAGYFEN